MEQKSMTALVSAFSRAYHYENNSVRIFSDSLAKALLTDEEYNGIAANMAAGAGFFLPGFEGTAEAALRRIVDEQLSPAPLGRAAWAEAALKTAVRTGARQYLLLGAGYDTFAYRRAEWASGLTIFELDRAAVCRDKQARLEAAGIELPANLRFVEADLTQGLKDALCKAGFDAGKITFCSLLGLVYYLPRRAFNEMLCTLGGMLAEGSALAFDYPDENSFNEKAGERAKKQAALAGGARESMLAGYSYAEMEALLAEHGFLIYEHLSPDDMTMQYFAEYNAANPAHQMTGFDNVNYCLAVRK